MIAAASPTTTRSEAVANPRVTPSLRRCHLRPTLKQWVQACNGRLQTRRLALGTVPLELGRPTDRKPPFKYSALTRVGFSDTDAQGIVYYGRYLPYFDLARVEYHRHLGLLRIDEEHELVMRASTVEYLAPARFDDLLEVFVRVERFGTTSVTYEFAAYRVEDDALMVTAKQTLVLVDLEERRAQPIPARMKEIVAAFERADLDTAART